MTRWLALALFVVLVVFAGGCKKKGTTATSDAPAIVVRDSSEGLLLTWVDDKGDFHVEQKTTDVPMMGRDAVRVVDPNKDEGTHEGSVYVADLRQAHPDGTYPVSVMSRADFEKIAEARREKNGPTLSSASLAAAASASAAASAQVRSDQVGGTGQDTGRATVIIYGAEWCGACHQAAAYLRRKGIPFVEKDIEKDAQAAREMQGKLRSAGVRNGGSIPVLDVRGKVMVGFNPQAVDEALGHAT
jgi:glutaredoxin